MGLDVYLDRKYNYKNENDYEVDEVAYWRKSYAIVAWFSSNVKSIINDNDTEEYRLNGVRNCVDYPVTRAEYHKLMKDCKKILSYRDKPDKLPKQLQKLCAIFTTYDGNFGTFGGYDEINIDELDYTYDSLAVNEKYINWNKDKIVFHISY